MFRFAHPEYLWLLWGAPLLLAVAILTARAARRRLRRFGNPDLLKPLMPERSPARRRLKVLLFTVAYVLLVLAAARPQMGSRLREVEGHGIEMMLAVDVSNSMLAEDFEPNRLERTKYAIGRLFEGLNNQERVGVIVFAGDAAVQLPITSDYRMARAFTRRISTTLAPVQGTDIGKALSLATISFSERKEGDQTGRAIILITDGEGHDSGALAAAERAAAEGIRIFTIGIGTPEGAPIRIDGELMKDENDEIVVSKLGEELLEEIARTTDGVYVRSTNQSLGLEEVMATLAEMEQGKLSTLRFEEYNELYGWFLGGALVLLLLEFLLLDRRNPRLKRLNVFGPEERQGI